MAAVDTLPATLTFGQRFNGLPSGQRMRLAIGVVLLVAVAIIAIVMSRQADWKVLYANLPEKDGGAVVAQLAQMNVPYKYSEGGAAIMVPADRVYDTRLRLASLGLPKGSITGFESMESNRFGMTQFQERLSFQRGLEGELTRSIQALSSVQSARVHLALPNQNGFFREQQKPSASVLVSLYPGHTLDRAQLAGIIHLVSSSVPEMPRSAVSVLDDSGKLLSAPGEGLDGGAGGVDAQQLQYAQQIESSYSRRILDILEPVVGRNNVKAQVSAEIDFSQTEQTSESHKPNQTPDSSAVRSQQTLESINGGGPQSPAGIPGATTNQPPPAASAPINGTAQAVAAAGGASGAAGAANASKRESIINYEVDKTVRVVRGGSGVVKRLSAAVVLNNQNTTDANGNTVSTPLSAEQLQKMTALVRETIGFNQERGDSVNLMNAPFAVDKAPTNDLPLWRQPEMQDMARSLAWPVAAVLFAIVLLLAVVRPAVKAMTAPPVVPSELTAADGTGLDAVVGEDPDRPSLLEGGGASGGAIGMDERQMRLEDARRITRENPAAVANIVKGWMGGEAAT